MTETIRVVLADDHPLVRAGIRGTLVEEGDGQIECRDCKGAKPFRAHGSVPPAEYL